MKHMLSSCKTSHLIGKVPLNKARTNITPTQGFFLFWPNTCIKEFVVITFNVLSEFNPWPRANNYSIYTIWILHKFN